MENSSLEVEWLSKWTSKKLVLQETSETLENETFLISKNVFEWKAK